MIPFTNRLAILLVAVFLTTIISLVLVAHTQSVEAEDVLHYVSTKIDQLKGTGAKSKGDDDTCQYSTSITSKIFSNMSAIINVPSKITYNVKGPKSSQIAILTATDGGGHNRDIANLTDLIVENRNAYAKHHGYIHHVINITKYDLGGVSPVWKKLPAVVETFNNFPSVQWVFWVDADAIFMTPTQDIQSLILSKEGMQKQVIPGATLITETKDDLNIHSSANFDFESIDLIIAQDWSGINAGTFLLRRSAFTQWMVDMWADPLFMYSCFERLEQDVLRHMLMHHETMRKHTGIARQRSINAYPEYNQDNAETHWQKGDLLIHFAGCWVGDRCQTFWDKIWPQRGSIP